MTLSRHSSSAPRVGRLVRRGWPLFLFLGAAAASCSDDDTEPGPGSPGAAGETMTAGSAGMGMGSAGTAGGSVGGSGMGGSAGMAMGGSAGMAMGGSAGLAMGGAGGNGMGGSAIASGGGTGIVEVLNDDAAQLLGPTTAAVVDNTVWVAIGQLGQLFADPPQPETPFRVVSVPLEGGAIGTEAIEFPGLDFFLEGIAASSAGELFVGTVTRGQIARVAPASTVADPFTDLGSAVRGVIGMTVDDPRSLLWYCDSNPVAEEPGGAVVGVSTTGGNIRQEVVRHELPGNVFTPAPPPVEPAPDVDAGVQDAGAAPPAQDAGAPIAVAPFCNDVLVLDGGDILVTDSSGRIFRIEAANALVADSAEVWLNVPELAPLSAGGFGVNGLDVVGASLIVANSDVGALVQVDPASADPASTVRSLTVTEGGFVTSLCGPDGLAAVPGSENELIVVENGFCAAGVSRVVKVTLDLN